MMRAWPAPRVAGYAPAAVSADSITASVPSMIAFATSLLRRAWAEDSDHRLQHLRRRDDRRPIRFAYLMISSGDRTSRTAARRPDLPRATITPSGLAQNALDVLERGSFSILAMMRRSSQKCTQFGDIRGSTDEAQCDVVESCSTANAASTRSLSVIDGAETLTPEVDAFVALTSPPYPPVR
jgi:hypothetical protein